MATLFPPAFLIALRTKFVFSNVNIESSWRTDNVLQNNLGPPNNMTVIKNLILYEPEDVIYLLLFPKTIPP